MPVPPPTPPAPIPVPPPALMAPVAQAAVTVQPLFSLTTVAQATGISTAELIAPFMALGIGSALKTKKPVKMKRTIAIGIREGKKMRAEDAHGAGGDKGLSAGKKVI